MFDPFLALADFITVSLMHLDITSRTGAALHFFVEDVTKIFTLLVLMIYVISLLRAGLDTARIRRFLSGKSRFAGYFLASLFGAVTPFCSCSSIPLFLGFTSARIPLGITMAFLITSPMVNEFAAVLLGTLIGVEFMVVYVITGMVAGVLGGFVIDAIGAEKYLTPLGHKAADTVSKPVESGVIRHLSLRERHDFAVEEVKTIFLRVWKWVIIGVGLGAFLHGFVPEQFISESLSSGAWWSVPVAVVIGIPLYSNASGMVPIAEALLSKGLPVGTTLAFMMSTVAVSFPEFMMLKQVMQPRLLAIFFGMLMVFFTLSGWMFNIFF